MRPRIESPAFVTWMLRAVSAGLGLEPAGVDPWPQVPKQQWPELLSFIAWHRLGPAVLKGVGHDGVGSMPAPWDDRLRMMVEQGTRRNLLLCQQLLELADQFEAAGIPYLTLKGLPLSMQAFGNLGFRFGRDIDVLISPQVYSNTQAVLRNLGYRPKPPQIPFEPPLRWQYTTGEIWCKDETLIDLHCSLDDPGSPFRMDQEKALSNPTFLTIGNKSLPVLDPHLQVVYLANHAAKHLWMRFFWLTDLVGLCQRKESLDWDRIHTLAAQIGMERRLWMSLQLASDLFTWQIPDQAKALGHRLGDVEAWREEWRGFTLMKRDYAKSQVMQIPPLRVFRWSLRLTDSPARRWRLVGAWFFRPLAADVLSWPLPSKLRFLYPFWRPLRLLWRALGFGQKKPGMP